MAGRLDFELGQILLDLGYVHREQINEALELQKIRPKRMGELLIDLGFVEEDQLLEALSRQFGIPFNVEWQRSNANVLNSLIDIPGFVKTDSSATGSCVINYLTPEVI